MRWYYFEEKQCKGPVEESVLLERMKDGTASGDLRVRTDAMANWIPLSEAVRQFGRNPRPAPAAPPGEIRGYSLRPEDALPGADVGMGAIGFAVLRGGVVALLGGWLWSEVSIAMDMQLGYFALFVGLVAGLAVRIFGDPDALVLAVVAALCGVLGIAFGNFLVTWHFTAEILGLSLAATYREVGLGGLFENMKAVFGPADLAFYGVGLVFAFQVARTRHWFRKGD